MNQSYKEAQAIVAELERIYAKSSRGEAQNPDLQFLKNMLAGSAITSALIRIHLAELIDRSHEALDRIGLAHSNMAAFPVLQARLSAVAEKEETVLAQLTTMLDESEVPNGNL